MSFEAPSWLSKDFLAVVLQGNEPMESNKTPVTVIKVLANPATAAGDGYTSNMYRVQVDYKSGISDSLLSTSLIIKNPNAVGLFSDLSEQVDFYGTEPKLYSEVLPLMNKKTQTKFAPTFYHCELKNVIILKDLKAEGYVLCDRLEQLDFKHSAAVIEMLAKFHAASVVCHHDHPTLIEEIGKERSYVKGGPYEERMRPWVESSIRYCGKIMKEMEEQECANLLFSRLESFYTSLVSIYKPKKGALNVLNHGDCWTSNVLFKHNDEGDVIDVKLIDFQYLRYGSPVNDLIFFIWSSVKKEVRHRKLDLLNIYIQTLNNTLLEVGCKERLDLKDLQEDLKTNADLILLVACFELAFMLSEPNNTVDIGSFSVEEIKNIENNKQFQNMYSGKYFRAALPDIIREVQVLY